MHHTEKYEHFKTNASGVYEVRKTEMVDYSKGVIKETTWKDGLKKEVCKDEQGNIISRRLYDEQGRLIRDINLKEKTNFQYSYEADGKIKKYEQLGHKFRITEFDKMGKEISSKDIYGYIEPNGNEWMLAAE